MKSYLKRWNDGLKLMKYLRCDKCKSYSYLLLVDDVKLCKKCNHINK